MMHTEQSYRAHWATLTGKAPSEIYVPEALRPKYICVWCGQQQASIPNTACSDCLKAEVEWTDQR